MRPNEGDTLRIVLFGLPRPPRKHNFMEWGMGVFSRRLFSLAYEAEVLVDFFDDPLRSREFVRTGVTYAAAALAGFHAIFSASYPPLVQVTSSSRTRS